MRKMILRLQKNLKEISGPEERELTLKRGKKILPQGLVDWSTMKILKKVDN